MHTGLLTGHFSGSLFLTGPLNSIMSREEIILKQLFCSWFLLLYFCQQLGHFFQFLFFLFLLLKCMACYKKCLSTELHIKVLNINFMFKVMRKKNLFILCIKVIKPFTEVFIIRKVSQLKSISSGNRTSKMK